MARKSTSKYWLLFLVWMLILAAFIIFYPQLLWMAFPGVFTNFVLALDLMDLN